MDSFEFIDDRSFKIDLKLFSKLFSHELKYLNEYFKLNNEMLIKKREELDLCLKHDIYHLYYSPFLDNFFTNLS